MSSPYPIRPTITVVLPRPTTPALPNAEEENIPYPYSYLIIMASEEEREAIRQKFISECNQYRWWHLYHNHKREAKK